MHHRTTWIALLVLSAGCEPAPPVDSAHPDALRRHDSDDSDSDDSDSDDSDSDSDDSDSDSDDEGALYAATDLVEGQTLSQWNARWWEWLVSIPAAESPGRGGDCQRNQGDEVFFLASTFGDGPAVRSCTVPEHTPIFIPSVTSIVFGCPDIWGVDDCYWSLEENIVPYVQDLADARKGSYTYSVTLDGVPLTGLDAYQLDAAVAWLDYDGTEPSVLLREKDRYGAGIPAEDVDCARGFDEGNICAFEPGPKAAATLGHAVMLRPLDDDAPHVLHVTGSRGTFAVDVTYTLTVED